MKNIKFLLSIILILQMSLSGCISNSGSSSSSKSSSSSSGASGSGGGTPTSLPTLLTISNVTITKDGSDTSYLTTIFFKKENSTDKISNYCDLNSAFCTCRFTWNELNQTNGSGVVIQRSAQTEVTQVQNYVATCAAPAVYDGEILSGTEILIEVVPQSLVSATIGTYTYTKPSASTSGSDFTDDEGLGFVNIHRYSCYEKIKKGKVVESRKQTSEDSVAGGSRDLFFATHFCAKSDSKDDSAQLPDNCEPETENSSQANYHNLFIESTRRGAFSLSNQKFSCPLVKESLGFSDENRPWPMDTSFALAQSNSGEFNVGVVAPSVLGITDDSTTASTDCSGGTVGPNSASISTRCIGFAKKPNSNGSCSYFKDSAGNIRHTFRLRRYIAVFPATFDATGRVRSQPHDVDVIYVVDRPVNSGDPLKPYAMHGPKPCPFAYFDKGGALGIDPDPGTDNSESIYSGGMPAYVGTGRSPSTQNVVSGTDTLFVGSSVSWTGKNVDNLHFPDTDQEGKSFCSAALPVVNYSNGLADTVSITTTHATNTDDGTTTGTAHVVNLGGSKTKKLTKVHIRPMDAFWPHYVEDTSFEACVPLADPFIDPPLHFAKQGNGNVSWCALAYPTQVNAVKSLDKTHDGSNSTPGYVKNYTSPVVKNSASTACTATIPDLPAGYPNPGVGACGSATTSYGAARHPSALIVDSNASGAGRCANRTCDRTVINSASEPWKAIPLSAEPSDIESALQSDSSYGCSVTWDNSNTLGKAASGATPSTGCCKSSEVFVTTAGSTPTTAHLEPKSNPVGNPACTEPTY